MNKLGFAIKLASQGAGNAIECNRGQWISKVVDIREYLKLFNGLQGTDNIVTFMSFDEGGCYLTLLRAISGRMGDFLSGWIYIPNTIEATGDDIMNTYNYVRNILSQSNLNDSIEDIEAFFSKEYPKKEFAAQYVPSSGEEFGVRFIDMYYSMKEILDTDRYQPYYSKFKAIFLLDKNSEVKIAKEQVARFKDLTKRTIEKVCIFKAPSPEEVRLLGRGTKIVFSTKQEFNSPVLTKKGDRIQLYALRDGFEPVILSPITIQEDGQKCFIDPKTVKWKKRISPSMFTVCNSKHEKIEDVRISINGTDITMGQELFLDEEDCRQATVKYSASDYEPFEHKRNLLLNEFCEVTLHRKVKSYQTTIELVNGEHAEMTLESKYLPSKLESPLKGYIYDEDYRGDKILKMDSWFVWKQRLWGFFASLGTVMIIIAFAAFDSWLDTHHFKLGLPPWEKDKTYIQPSQPDQMESDELTPPQESAILVYLNSNAQWTREQLEKDSITHGLYDMINEYRFPELVNVNIDGCDNISKIKSLAQEMNANNISISGTYSQDGTITVQKWIDKVRAKIDELQNGFDDIDAGFNNNQADIARKKAAEEAAKKKSDAEAAKKKAAEDAKKKKKSNNPFDL